jgi:hypothetical protein
MEVNYLAILVGAIASMVLGALWYSPALFGTAWMKLCGMTQKDLEEAKKKGMAKSYAINFVAVLLTSYVMAHFVQGWFESQSDYSGLVIGLKTGFWLWLGFFATSMLGMVLWEGRPMKLYLINTSYYLAQLLMLGAIIGGWLS